MDSFPGHPATNDFDGVVVPTGEVLNFLFEDYDAVLKFLKSEM